MRSQVAIRFSLSDALDRTYLGMLSTNYASRTRPSALLLGVFVAALVGCTGEPTGSLESAETVGTSAPVAEAEAESEAFPIEFLERVPLSSPSGLVLLAGDTIIDVDEDSERRVDGRA